MNIIKVLMVGWLLMCCAPVMSAEDEHGQGGPPPVFHEHHRHHYGTTGSWRDPRKTVWYGFAVSPNGRGFQSDGGYSEEDERASARIECENASGRTCVAISVPESWDVVGLRCKKCSVFNGFVGGSGQGSAKHVALDKAKDAGFSESQCIEVLNY
jgi:hypothetical protein